MAGKARKPKRSTRSHLGKHSLDLSIAEAVQLGIGLHQQGKREEAVAIYRQILAAHPDQGDALHFLGIAEHQCGRSEKGLELIGRAAALLPSHPDVHNNRGNILKQLGRLDEAEAAYRKTLELRPNDPSAINNLGTVLRERGQYPEAVQAFREVIALRPDHYGAHQNLGNTLASLNRFEEALEEYRCALELQPSTGEAYRHIGGMFYALGRIAEAEEIYRRWQAVEPNNPVPKHMIAACSKTDVPDRAPDDYIREAFDNFASTFDSSLERLQYRAPELVVEAVVEALGASARVPAVLDAGCGTGLCAPGLRPFADRLIGVDLSEKMLARAGERALYDELIPRELTEYLTEHPSAFDLVVSADTLVYFGPLEDVCAAAMQALRLGGHLIFTVERSEEEDTPLGFRIHPHGRYSHTESYLRRVLAAAGFEVTQLRPVELRREAGKWVNGSLVTARRRRSG